MLPSPSLPVDHNPLALGYTVELRT